MYLLLHRLFCIVSFGIKFLYHRCHRFYSILYLFKTVNRKLQILKQLFKESVTLSFIFDSDKGIRNVYRYLTSDFILWVVEYNSASEIRVMFNVHECVHLSNTIAVHPRWLALVLPTRDPAIIRRRCHLFFDGGRSSIRHSCFLFPSLDVSCVSFLRHLIKTRCLFLLEWFRLSGCRPDFSFFFSTHDLGQTK